MDSGSRPHRRRSVGIAGPAIDGNGSTRASSVEQPLRRDDAVQPPQHLGALHALAQRTLAAGAEARPRRRPKTSASPAAPPTTRPPAESNARSGGKRSPARKNDPDHRPERLEHGCPDDRPAERDQWRVGRVRAAVQHGRCDARADHGAGDDADDRQRARDEPLAQPGKAGEQDQPEQDPVDESHRSWVRRETIESCREKEYPR